MSASHYMYVVWFQLMKILIVDGMQLTKDQEHRLVVSYPRLLTQGRFPAAWWSVTRDS